MLSRISLRTVVSQPGRAGRRFLQTIQTEDDNEARPFYCGVYDFYFLFCFCLMFGVGPTPAYVAINSLRARYTLAKANKVNRWAAFLAKPR